MRAVLRHSRRMAADAQVPAVNASRWAAHGSSACLLAQLCVAFLTVRPTIAAMTCFMTLNLLMIANGEALGTLTRFTSSVGIGA